MKKFVIMGLVALVAVAIAARIPQTRALVLGA